tara:strand:+ start:2563 stop:3225 length:663 start_codon:yes stop_codon:yes gene_type:complete
VKVEQGNVVPLFSSPVYIPDERYPIDDDLLKFCKNVELYEYESDTNTNILAKAEAHTSLNDQILKCEELSDVSKFIERNLNYYFHELLAVKDDIEIYIVQSWLMKYIKGDNIHVHSHSNSILSGTFHIQGIHCPMLFHNMQNYSFGSIFHFDRTNLKEENILNSEEIPIPNSNGRMILHPSPLQHSVGVYEGETPRIGISFNTWIRGKIGIEYARNALYL